MCVCVRGLRFMTDSLFFFLMALLSSRVHLPSGPPRESPIQGDRSGNERNGK